MKLQFARYIAPTLTKIFVSRIANVRVRRITNKCSSLKSYKKISIKKRIVTVVIIVVYVITN